jgi:membrane protease subunit HflK
LDWDDFKGTDHQQNDGLQQVEEVFKNLQDKIKGKFPGGWIVLVILILLWIGSGIYIISPDEVGVVKRFGKYIYSTQAGPHFHIPYPIETVLKPKVTEVKRMLIWTASTLFSTMLIELILAIKPLMS